MTTTTKLSVGTLGGPGTFAGQATTRLLELYPDLGDVSYYASVEGVWSALDDHLVDNIVLTEQATRTGFGDADKRVASVDKPTYVTAEAIVPYGCSLLVKHGTRLEDIKHVLGHGSINQCRNWLGKNLPNASTAVHEQNSMAAAKEVANGDKTLAVVATMKTAEISGLEALARNIDDGAAGNWWALSLRPHFHDRPTHVLVAGRFGGDGLLGDAIAAISKRGYRLRYVYPQPTLKAIFEYDCLVSFIGNGELAAVEREVSAIPSARIVGAMNGPVE